MFTLRSDGQEKILKEKQKPKEPKEASDTATSGQPSAAADKGDVPITATPQDVSPFACLSSTMGWETFHMVHVLWIGMVDTAGKPAEKDWELQVCSHDPYKLFMALILHETMQHC